MGSFQLGRIKRQLRTIETANIRIRDLFPLLYPSLGRIQTGDVGRQTFDKIVGWNHSLRIIFPHDCICLSAGEDGLNGKNEDVYISQIVIEGEIRHRAIISPDSDPQSTRLNYLNRVIKGDHVIRRTSFSMEASRGALRLTVSCRITFVLVGQASNFDIAKPKLTDQTLQDHEPFRALDSVMVEMSVSGKNDIDPDGWKLGLEPLWVILLNHSSRDR
jgi:hypothetical protein